jgi:predicted MFS family arabinose efflux permease
MPPIGYRRPLAVELLDGSEFETISLPRFLASPPERPAMVSSARRFRFAVSAVLLPFTAGYYLGHVYRGITALISDELVAEFSLSPTDLGILSAVLLLAYGSAQLPLGAWLDRSGPRRVQVVLLSVAAVGAFVFAGAQDYAALLMGRVLIGLGIAGALMAGLKAVVLWFPAERFALANGCIVMLGALGAVTATVPAEFLVAGLGWRGLFFLLAAITAATALAIAYVVPEMPDEERADTHETAVSLSMIYRDARFWQIAPLSAAFVGSAWALQGLWAGPWLADVAGLPRHDIVAHLLAMAVAFSASALALGASAGWLRSRGISLSTTLGALSAVALLAQVSLVLNWTVPTWLPWIAIAAMGAGTVLSYAMVTEHFPRSASGRATGALNLLHVGMASVVQIGFGVLLHQWPADGGHVPASAYHAALAAVLVLEAAALLWFIARRKHRTLHNLVAHPIHAMAATFCIPPEAALSYAYAQRSWRAMPRNCCRRAWSPRCLA